ncbi:hypothetical protein ACFO1B_37325 [Dactylosporangium siamense]|uniref:Carboxypeptidase regulatory-like domain-containing protein n=1 Tax=Dactylosporangium siamense TaxID=685454 RepID=A0A919PSJ8_9ACTN|nr:hypothetical protein [Dactylosporangium siamense]GIG49432.1 hypothetical protein Dsi01nite_074730 [Dactylosporangium siamense]
MDDDDTLLAELRRIAGIVDPVPADLLFSLSITGFDIEVCRLVPQPPAGLLAGVRGDEETTRATFESASLTIMVEWTAGTNGTVRLDGWLAPPVACRIELRTVDGPQTMDTDEGGRFAAARISRGEVQIRVHATTDQVADGVLTVVTPSFVV